MERYYSTLHINSKDHKELLRISKITYIPMSQLIKICIPILKKKYNIGEPISEEED